MLPTPNFHRHACLAAILAALLISGCARSKVVTEVKADGSFTRTMTLTGQGAGGPEGFGGGSMGPKLEEVIAIPAGWTIKEEMKKTDRVITAVMTFKPGAVSKGDVTIKESPTKPALVNDVTVRQTAPGRFEYREVLHWVGEKPKGPALSPKEVADIKSVLPGALATDANARGLAVKVAEQAYPLLFGPGDPLLSLGLMHPDLAERRITQKLGGVVLQALQQQFGDQLTAAQRRDVARKVITTSLSSTMQSDRMKPQPPGGPPSGDEAGGNKSGSALVPLLFVLKVPGKVIETNGEVDDLSGEIFWAMFGEAAALKDVVLTATFEKAP